MADIVLYPRPPSNSNAEEQGALAVDDFTWAIVDQQKTWLDGHPDRDLGMVAVGLMKLGEETGEAFAAWIGVTGANKRKGVTHTLDDVVAEVADVAVTALVTLATLTGDARDVLAAHLGRIYTRSLEYGAPPLPKAEFNPDRQSWLASLPRVLAATVVLCTDEDGRVLLVRQDYREGPRNWYLPGGGMDDDEPPRIGARREVLEEIALDITVGRMLAINWNPATDRPPLIVYTFDGGTLTREQVGRIQLPDGELGAFGFFSLKEAEPLMSLVAFRELTQALDVRAGHTPVTDLREGRPAGTAGPAAGVDDRQDPARVLGR